jgi:hypothetical protein
LFAADPAGFRFREGGGLALFCSQGEAGSRSTSEGKFVRSTVECGDKGSSYRRFSLPAGNKKR